MSERARRVGLNEGLFRTCLSYGRPRAWTR